MAEINILVVDDEKEIAELVEIYLVSDGYHVYKAYNAEDGLKLLASQEIHLVLLDIMMPGMDGLTMCRKIRETSNVPIIMLSAKSTDLDKIVGLTGGADDYVTKPFNPLELTARVKSQLRRYTQLNPNAAGQFQNNEISIREMTINKDNHKVTIDGEDIKLTPIVNPLELTARVKSQLRRYTQLNPNAAGQFQNNEITIREMTINKDNHKVTIDGEDIKLTPIEFDILFLLASHPGKVFSTDEIFEKVWNEKVYEANNTVMVHIRRLRGKMKEDQRENKIISTVWGVGYKIDK